MADSVKKNTAYAVEIEDTEGTYKAPQAATSYVQVLQDGAELTYSKELIERNVFTASLGKVTPRTGQMQVAGALPTECRAAATEGGAPEYDKLLRAGLGLRRQKTTDTTTKASGNTGSVLQIEDADIEDFAIGDIVLVKQAGAYHVSPVSAVDDSTGAANITLRVPKASGSFANSVVIAKFTTYTVANSGFPSLSVSKYTEGTVLEKAVGCRVNSIALEGFTTGALPTLNFGMEGLNFDASLTAIPHTPSYSTAKPPIILGAYVYMDGVAIQVNEVSFALENVLGFKTATEASNGRISGRVTGRTLTGTMLPYKPSDSISLFTKYKQNTPFDLFCYAMNPSTTAGQFGEVIAFYCPNCTITEMSEADQDGLLQLPITFSIDEGASGGNNEIYLGFI